jgi:hypothetical protein
MLYTCEQTNFASAGGPSISGGRAGVHILRNAASVGIRDLGRGSLQHPERVRKDLGPVPLPHRVPEPVLTRIREDGSLDREWETPLVARCQPVRKRDHVAGLVLETKLPGPIHELFDDGGTELRQTVRLDTGSRRIDDPRVAEVP